MEEFTGVTRLLGTISILVPRKLKAQRYLAGLPCRLSILRLMIIFDVFSMC